MKDTFQMLENVKQGNYNNYIGNNQHSDLKSSERPRGSSPHFSSIDRKKNRAKPNMVEEDQARGASLGEAESEGIQAQQMDIRSVAESQTTHGALSMKAHRVLQIKRLEKELIKLQRRFETVTDPEYISGLKMNLKEMEVNQKQSKDMINKLEIEHTILDKRIIKNSKNYENLTSLNGQDRKTSMQIEVMASIEITQRRIDNQALEKHKLYTEQTRINTEVARENEKNSKLVKIAEQKYSMDLTKVDMYLPKGRDHEDKLRALEAKLVGEQRQQVASYRNENRAEE